MIVFCFSSNSRMFPYMYKGTSPYIWGFFYRALIPCYYTGLQFTNPKHHLFSRLLMRQARDTEDLST